MSLGRFATARALAAAVAAMAVAGCADSGNPGGPNGAEVRVSAVSPSTGTTFGGTTVTITGTGFASGATVLIGGTAATNVTVTNSTTISARTPVHAAGNADVRVTVGTKVGTLVNGFLFTVPAAVVNTPPVVSAITVQPPRPDQPATLASTGDRMSLTASVNDAETPAAQLIYEWTTTPTAGTFTGTGPAVQWTAPSTVTVPQTVVLTLTVVERYQEPDATGLPVQREHRVPRSALVKVHNTVKEVSDMAVDFLTLFSNSSITNPDLVLHNFSRTCDNGNGYGDEKEDVIKNRRDFVILSHKVTPPTFFEYEFGASNACTNRISTPGDVCVEVPMEWTNRCTPGSLHEVCLANAPNYTETVRGIDFVTGVYENAQWRLCHSRWTGVSTTTGKPVYLDYAERRRIIKGPKDK